MTGLLFLFWMAFWLSFWLGVRWTARRALAWMDRPKV